MEQKKDSYLENYYRGKYKPRGRQTIYIVPDNVTKIQYTDPWRDVIPRYLEDLGYIVKTLDPNMSFSMFGPGGDLLYRAKQMELIATRLITNSIHNGDIFIFQNIWNPILPTIEQYKRQSGRKMIVTIGIWREDTVSAVTERMKYQRTDNPLLDYKRKEWAIHFSFGFMKACDFVLFDNNDIKDDIWWAKAFKKSEWTKLKDYKGYPLSLAKRYIEYPIEKENIILIPYGVTTHNEKFYLDRLKAEFGKDYRIVELCDVTNCTREVYLDWLRRAKVVINFSKLQQHFKTWYEPFLYRTYIFTHDKIRPQGVLPEKYTYSRKLFAQTIPLMIFRNWMPLMARIKDVLENYEKYLPELEADEKFLTKKYFPSDDFCKILEYLKR